MCARAKYSSLFMAASQTMNSKVKKNTSAVGSNLSFPPDKLKTGMTENIFSLPLTVEQNKVECFSARFSRL